MTGPKARYHPPLTTTRRALLTGGGDTEFRRLVYRLSVIEERLRHARTYFGRRIGLSGPQYMLLVSVAYLQGASGMTVRALARELRVTSAFVTSESYRLIERGLLAKRPNPHDSRSTLITVTAAGRRRLEALVPEVRKVNDLFFGRLSSASFRAALRFLDQLADGSAQALTYIAHREGRRA